MRKKLIILTLAVTLGIFIFCARSRNKEKALPIADKVLANAQWGIVIQDRRSGEILFEHNSTKLFVPASITKLFTAEAALATFGPSHTLRTTVNSSASATADGVLHGSLLIAGNYNPGLSYKHMSELAAKIYDLGVRRILGKVIVREPAHLITHAEWEDIGCPYCPEVHPLSIEGNQVGITVLPAQSPGLPSEVRIDQPIPFCTLVNKTMTTPTASNGGKAISPLTAKRGLADNVIEITGNIPAASGQQRIAVSLHSPQEYARLIFIHELEKLGIEVLDGDTQSEESFRNVLAAVDSPPVAELIAVMNKSSDNFTAEMLYEAAAAQLSGQGGESERSPFSTVFKRLGMQSKDAVFASGSGLSRHNAVSPVHVAALLAYIDKAPYRQAFFDSLPIAAVDGTLASRYEKSALEGVLKAKTGYLSGCSSLAGYAQTGKGRELRFCVFVNQATADCDTVRTALDDTLIHLMKRIDEKTARL